jgi:hypothetical protein
MDLRDVYLEIPFPITSDESGLYPHPHLHLHPSHIGVEVGSRGTKGGVIDVSRSSKLAASAGGQD